MSDQFLFVGEKPSKLAQKRGVTWIDGGLAAKQLFDALAPLGISGQECRFENLFGDDPTDAEKGPHIIVRAARIRDIAAADGREIVAMGQKVSRALHKLGLPHRIITHPAARGRIRAKERYAAHIREALGGQ